MSRPSLAATYKNPDSRRVLSDLSKYQFAKPVYPTGRPGRIARLWPGVSVPSAQRHRGLLRGEELPEQSSRPTNRLSRLLLRFFHQPLQVQEMLRPIRFL
jgi:hypothetical protein